MITWLKFIPIINLFIFFPLRSGNVLYVEIHISLSVFFFLWEEKKIWQPFSFLSDLRHYFASWTTVQWKLGAVNFTNCSLNTFSAYKLLTFVYKRQQMLVYCLCPSVSTTVRGKIYLDPQFLLVFLL